MKHSKIYFPGIFSGTKQEYKETAKAYRTRIEGSDVAGVSVGHTSAHVGIAGQVEVLHQHGLGTFWKLEANCGSGNVHVGICRKTRDVVFENHLLVAHFRHCCLLSFFLSSSKETGMSRRWRADG